MLLQCKICAERFSKFHSPLQYTDCGDYLFYKLGGMKARVLSNVCITNFIVFL